MGDFYFGASDEARTRYLHLGKVALYQMSYTRGNSKDYIRIFPIVKGKGKISFLYRNWNICPNWTYSLSKRKGR